MIVPNKFILKRQTARMRITVTRLFKGLQAINDRKKLFEHDIRFLSTAFLHVQLVHTTLRRLQRQFLAPLFQYLIQYFTLNSLKKKWRNMEGAGSQTWHRRSLGDFNASVANVLQTSCESEWVAKERQRFTRSTSTGTQSIKISLSLQYTLCTTKMLTIWAPRSEATPTYEYQTMKHKYCITPSVFIFEQDRDNFLITYFGAQRQNNI